ncbi:MAG: MBL fold metallo-hydrolase, partial [Sciscionella sp.]
DRVLVLDPAHDVEAILAGIGGRTVSAILCTHGHSDHVNAAPALADATSAPILLHPQDTVLWEMTHPDRRPDRAVADGDTLRISDTQLRVMHTPGHAPGSVCLYSAEDSVLFSGDTLFAGGPGATGRSYSDFDTIISSISERLLPLPADTLVHTGHGPDTNIGAEAPNLADWISRGH